LAIFRGVPELEPAHARRNEERARQPQEASSSAGVVAWPAEATTETVQAAMSIFRNGELKGGVIGTNTAQEDEGENSIRD